MNLSTKSTKDAKLTISHSPVLWLRVRDLDQADPMAFAHPVRPTRFPRLDFFALFVLLVANLNSD
jgi:hypothetical protein